MRAQQRALGRFAAHRNNVANAYVGVVSLHRHVGSARIHAELRGVECVVVIEHVVGDIDLYCSLLCFRQAG